MDRFINQDILVAHRVLEEVDALYRELGLNMDLIYQARNDELLKKLERVANFELVLK